MPKKSASKVSTMTKEESDVGLEKPKSASKSKKKDEIDEIFSSRKRKDPEISKVEKPEETNLSKKKKKKKSKILKESVIESNSKPRRKTNDGLTIYSEEELGIKNNEAGGTPLCPFDCSCCY